MDYEGVASIALLPSGNLSGHFVDSSSKKCFGLMGTEFVCERECSHGEDYRLLRLTVIDFAPSPARGRWDVGVIAAATSAAAGGPPGNDKCPIVHFECAMLKADAEAEAHLRRFQPALLNKHAVVNTGPMTLHMPAREGPSSAAAAATAPATAAAAAAASAAPAAPMATSPEGSNQKSAYSAGAPPSSFSAGRPFIHLRESPRSESPRLPQQPLMGQVAGACVAPSAPAHPPADGAAGSRSSDRQDVEATSPAGTVQLSPVGSREAARELDACGRWEEQVSAPLTWSEEAEGLPRSGEASETTGAAENQEIAEESIDHPNASPGYATAGAPHAFSDGHAGCFLDHSFGSTGGEEEPAMGANGGSLLSRACPPQILPRFDDPFQQILREELQREGLHAKNEREDAELATVVREGSASACSPSGWEETGEGWRAKKRPKES